MIFFYFLNCADVDECSTSNPPCSPQAICQDTSGSYLCMCMQGYEGDGLTCTGQSNVLVAVGHPTFGGGCYVEMYLKPMKV